ncbi:MAG: cobyric acid synthase, partial [Pseudomonadota bacterium]
MRALMLQGTGSDVGKSLLVAALCRLAKRRGIAVAPFKPQNMSNNAAACANGGEIGRAQALQARAAELEPRVDFNPVLLKPQSDRAAQVIVHGHPVGTLDAQDYFASRGRRLGAVLESFERLANTFELVVVEGAGSPSEINLRRGDIANMGFARAADVPVCLVGDIEKGGVIASIVGTKAVLDPADAAMIRGFVINKFRGDPRLFDDGLREIETRTSWRSFGVVPWLSAASRLPAEDAVVLDRSHSAGARDGKRLVVAAPMLSRIANFDDADPLRLESGVDFRWVPPGQALPRDADVVVLFGTKSTLADLRFLREQGWDHDIIAHARSGGRVLGLCGGYQLLGRRIHDPDGIDGASGDSEGLGLLAVETVMRVDKTVRPVTARCTTSDEPVAGYEIHVGETTGADCSRPFLDLAGRPEGARSPDGRIAGTYVHGLFAADGFRRAWLADAGARTTEVTYEAEVEVALDALADGVEAAVDVDGLLALAA